MSFYKVIATSGNEIVSYSTFVRNSFEVPFCFKLSLYRRQIDRGLKKLSYILKKGELLFYTLSFPKIYLLSRNTTLLNQVSYLTTAINCAII